MIPSNSASWTLDKKSPWRTHELASHCRSTSSEDTAVCGGDTSPNIHFQQVPFSILVNFCTYFQTGWVWTLSTLQPSKHTPARCPIPRLKVWVSVPDLTVSEAPDLAQVFSPNRGQEDGVKVYQWIPCCAERRPWWFKWQRCGPQIQMLSTNLKGFPEPTSYHPRKQIKQGR